MQGSRFLCCLPVGSFYICFIPGALNTICSPFLLLPSCIPPARPQLRQCISFFLNFQANFLPLHCFLFPLKLARDWPFTQANRECENQEQSLMKLGENNHVMPNCIQDFFKHFPSITHIATANSLEVCSADWCTSYSLHAGFHLVLPSDLDACDREERDACWLNNSQFQSSLKWETFYWCLWSLNETPEQTFAIDIALLTIYCSP